MGIYVAKGQAAKGLDPIHEKLNTAQHQWNTYADALGLGYVKAYRRHTDVLNEMKNGRKPDSSAMWFVFTSLCTGFAGGVVGGLLAPWVKDAAGKIGERLKDFERAVVSDAAKELAKSSYKWMFQDMATTPSYNEIYRPAAVEPLEYHLDIKVELGRLFGVLRDHLSKMQKSLDGNHPLGIADPFAWWINMPVLRDQPGPNDLPKAEVVETQAEIGMHIAWCSVRDFEYWDKARVNITHPSRSPHHDYVMDYLYLEPLRRRLHQLGVNPALTTVSVQIPGYGQYNVLNIHAVRNIGPALGGPFLSKVKDVITDPYVRLPTLALIEPIFKKPYSYALSSKPASYPPQKGRMLENYYYGKRN